MDEILLMKLTSSMTFDEIEENFRSSVDDKTWSEFSKRYMKHLEFSVSYHADHLTKEILEMRKRGYSDVQIGFIGGFEFMDPHGDTIKLRGI